jgi:hypothetical protein
MAKSGKAKSTKKAKAPTIAKPAPKPRSWQMHLKRNRPQPDDPAGWVEWNEVARKHQGKA